MSNGQAFADEIVARAYRAYHPTSGELGFSIKKGFKKIGRGVKKVGKGAYKYSGTKFLVKTNIKLAKLQAKLALLPLKYLAKAVRAVGKVILKAPEPVLSLAVSQAGISPSFIPLFRTAVNENKWSLKSVKRLLPPALKVAANLAASGMFPPIVPALAVVRRLPYVGRFVGAEETELSGVDTRLVRQAMDLMQVLALADYLDCLDERSAVAIGLGPAERQALHGLLAGQVELAGSISTIDKKAMVLGGVTVAAAVLGFYLLFR